MKFIVHDKDGNILRSGHCQKKAFPKQAGVGEFVMEGQGNDVRQKVVDGKIVDKTPAEIERDSPKTRRPHGGRRAHITNGQLEGILGRLKALEDNSVVNRVNNIG